MILVVVTLGYSIREIGVLQNEGRQNAAESKSLLFPVVRFFPPFHILKDHRETYMYPTVYPTKRICS